MFENPYWKTLIGNLNEDGPKVDLAKELIAAGDPDGRATFIELQLKASGTALTDKEEKKLAGLLRKNQKTWLGALADARKGAVFKKGFVDELATSHTMKDNWAGWDDEGWGTVTLIELSKRVPKFAKNLRTIVWGGWYPEEAWVEMKVRLAEDPSFFAHVEEICFGVEHWNIGHALVRSCPNLKRISFVDKDKEVPPHEPLTGIDVSYVGAPSQEESIVNALSKQAPARIIWCEGVRVDTEEKDVSFSFEGGGGTEEDAIAVAAALASGTVLPGGKRVLSADALRRVDAWKQSRSSEHYSVQLIDELNAVEWKEHARSFGVYSTLPTPLLDAWLEKNALSAPPLKRLPSLEDSPQDVRRGTFIP